MHAIKARFKQEDIIIESASPTYQLLSELSYQHLCSFANTLSICEIFTFKESPHSTDVAFALRYTWHD